MPELLAWDPKLKRMVTIYLPLSLFIIVLLFPFYWMTITAFKPDHEMYDYKDYTPFWVHSPTLQNIKVLLFETNYPRWLIVTMSIAVGSTFLSVTSSVLRRLCDRAAAVQGRAAFRAGDLPGVSGAAVDPVHSAGDADLPVWVV